MNAIMTSLPRSAVSNWSAGVVRYGSTPASLANACLSCNDVRTWYSRLFTRVSVFLVATGAGAWICTLNAARTTQATSSARTDRVAAVGCATATRDSRRTASVARTTRPAASSTMPATAAMPATRPMESCRNDTASSSRTQSSTRLKGRPSDE